jgi:hypothetical protein
MMTGLPIERLTSVARRAATAAVIAAATVALLGVPAAHAAFGIKPGSFRAEALNANGSVDVQAGSHPYEYVVGFEFNLNPTTHAAEGSARDIAVDLPPGLIGNPLATPRCTAAEFEGIQPHCAADTQVGFFHATLGEPVIAAHGPIYNLVPPSGVPARLGFEVKEIDTYVDASVRTGAGYGVVTKTDNVPVNQVAEAKVTIWGVPADPGHDPERYCREGRENGIESGGVIEGGCVSTAPERPFLTLPTSCGGPLLAQLSADSTEAPGVFVSSPPAEASGLSGCEKLSFEPKLELQPEQHVTNTPTGLNVDLSIPQDENFRDVATAELREAVVTLPQGLRVNPSAASGLQTCPLLRGREAAKEAREERREEVGIDLESGQPANCPAESKIGSVEIETPPLEHPLKGSIFLAQQGNFGGGANPFGSLFALYIAAEGEGVVAKIPGEIQLGENGQITARFGRDPVTGEEFLPQLPYSNLKMTIFGGPRAPLATSSACGSSATASTLTPWTSTEAAPMSVTLRESFQIDAGCNAPGFAPAFATSVTNAQAGAYTSFTTSFARQGSEQTFENVTVTTPPGLLGIVKNVEQCPEAQANAGDCSAASQLGETSASVGAGDDPYTVTGGKVYLTGPYGGGPFGLSIVVPTTAGPFTLDGDAGFGKEVVRAAIEVNPHTAQITVKANPLPTSLEDIALDIREVNVTINRSNFMFNPTNCETLKTEGTISSAQGAAKHVESPMAAVNCATLPFKPSFTASTLAKSSKADGASLTVHVAQQPGEADIHKTDLQLPLALPARLTTLQKACTEKQFAANPAGCPEASDIGTAIAHTPLLSGPFVGPAYLVSHGGAAFPDVEFVLQGENGVEVVLDGGTDIKKGITYSKFETVPDAPISSFETVLPEGPHSALTTENPGVTNLCAPTKPETVKERVTVHSHGRTKHVTKKVTKQVAESLTIPTTLVGQNGAVVTQATKIAVTGCAKIKQTTKTKKKKTARRGKKR